VKCELCLRRESLAEIDGVWVCADCGAKLLEEKPVLKENEKWLKGWLENANKLERI